MTQRIFLSGPMSGLPEFNLPTFHAAADLLRTHGHHVENPAENPEPPVQLATLAPSATRQSEIVLSLPPQVPNSAPRPLAQKIARAILRASMEAGDGEYAPRVVGGK